MRLMTYYMTSRFLKNLNPVVFHVLYWLFFFLFETTIRVVAVAGIDFKTALFSVLADFGALVLLAYILSEKLIPSYFRAKKKTLPALYVLILITVVNPVLCFLNRTFVVIPNIFPDLSPFDLGTYLEDIMLFIFASGPIAGISIARLIRTEMVHHRKVEEDKLRAEIRLREAELQLLKGQIQPHFLFNTLNNLYSLSLDRSEKVPDLIQKLNSLLRYVIYECNSEKVSMVKEIDFIRSFIELQRLRFDTDAIDLVIEGEPGDLRIGPMILQTFIDNSIKHGKQGDGINPWIQIYLGIRDRLLSFTVTNPKDPMKSNNNYGIGISNVLKRLDLLYSGRYKLDITDGSEQFSVSLSVEL